MNNKQIAFVGDFSFPFPVSLLPKIDSAKNITKSYLVVGNLESSMISQNKCCKLTRIYSTSYLKEFLTKQGIKIVSLANNHIMDYSTEGLCQLIDLLNKNRILHCGAGIDLTKATKPLEIQIGKRKWAFLSYAWPLVEAIPAHKNRAGIAPLNKKLIIKIIHKLKSRNNEICIMLHWGYEYEKYPLPAHRKLAHKLIDAGATIIIGHHPHRIQGIEYYKNKMIAYSLGNFFFPLETYSKLQRGYYGYMDKYKGLLIQYNPDQPTHSTLFEADYNSADYSLKINHITNNFLSELKLLSKPLELNNKQYLKFFKENRERRKFLPIMTGGKLDIIKSIWVKIRSQIIYNIMKFQNIINYIKIKKLNKNLYRLLVMQNFINKQKMKLYYKSPCWVQNVFINSEKLLDKIKYSKTINKISKELEITEKWDYKKLEKLQMEKFKKLLKHAYNNVPYYYRLFKNHRLKPKDIQTRKDITKIPFLTKDIVRKNFKDLIAKNIKRKNLVHSHTSGTTGSPFEFYMDKYTQAFYRAHIIRHRRWWGYNYNEPCASFGGKIIVPLQQNKPPFWRYDYPEKLIVFSSFHLKPKFIDSMIKFIQKKNIQCIKGYPSNLFILAQYLRNKKIILPMKWIFTGAEPILPYMQEIIENQFGTKIADFYGQSEEVARAYQCPKSDGYHMAMESTLIEIMKNNNKPAEHGEYGEIVGTSLTNFAMPFIRYKTGDITRMLTKKYSCEKQFPLIDKIIGKFEDVVISKDKRLISPSALTHPFKPLDSRAIVKSQIIQNEVGKINIRIVQGTRYNKNQENILIKNFEERFQNQLDIKITYVADIKKTKAGKYRWVIRNIPIDYKNWSLKILK